MQMKRVYLILLSISCLWCMAACSPITAENGPDSTQVMTTEEYSDEVFGEEIIEDDPTTESSDMEFVPDYEEGTQNVEWGNTPSNLMPGREGAMARQADYLYYSFPTRFDSEFQSTALYKMPVGGTTSGDVTCLLEEGRLDGAPQRIQVLENWIYFCIRIANSNEYDYEIYRVRTDGSQLEALLLAYSSDFIVYKDYIYYTIVSKTNVTANTYEFAHQLMVAELDGSIIGRVATITSDSYIGGISLHSYDPSGYLYLYIGDPNMVHRPYWFIYSLSDDRLVEPINQDRNSPPYPLIVGTDGTAYFKYGGAFNRNDAYAQISADMFSSDNYQKIETETPIIIDAVNRCVADDTGFYYSCLNATDGIYYYNRSTNEILTICGDSPWTILFPGDGYLYYSDNNNDRYSWSRIASSHGSAGTDWEFVDWMTP